MENTVECSWPWSRRFSTCSEMFSVKGKNRGFAFGEVARLSLREDGFVRAQSRLQLAEDGARVLLVSVETAHSSVDRRRDGVFIKEETGSGTWQGDTVCFAGDHCREVQVRGGGSAAWTPVRFPLALSAQGAQ